MSCSLKRKVMHLRHIPLAIVVAEWHGNLFALRYIFGCTYVESNRVLLKYMLHLSATIESHTHTHPFNGPLSGTTQVSRYQKGKTNLDFTGARDSERQWYQLGHMQVCTSLQTDNHASTSLLKYFYRPDALPAAQPTVSKHCN